MSPDAARVVELPVVTRTHQRLVRAVSSIMKRPALLAGDRPQSHSFHVKTVLYIVVNATRRIVPLAVLTAMTHAAIAVVVIAVIATTLAGKSTFPEVKKTPPGTQYQQLSRRPTGHLLNFKQLCYPPFSCLYVILHSISVPRQEVRSDVAKPHRAMA
jgi:hypothetical protein